MNLRSKDFCPETYTDPSLDIRIEVNFTPKSHTLKLGLEIGREERIQTSNQE